MPAVRHDRQRPIPGAADDFGQHHDYGETYDERRPPLVAPMLLTEEIMVMLPIFDRTAVYRRDSFHVSRLSISPVAKLVFLAGTAGAGIDAGLGLGPRRQQRTLAGIVLAGRGIDVMGRLISLVRHHSVR